MRPRPGATARTRELTAAVRRSHQSGLTSTVDFSDPAQLGFDPDAPRSDRPTTSSATSMTVDWPAGRWLVSRHGEVAHMATSRSPCIVKRPCRGVDDTMVRMYSMTKPITSVAAMMLYEEGAFQLKDPVSKFIPSFGDRHGCTAADRVSSRSRSRVTEPMQMWHLLTHTSGLTYGFHHQHVTDAIYRAHGLRVGVRRRAPISRRAAMCGPAMPLAFQPGQRVELRGVH